MSGPPIDAITEPWWAATRERRLVLQSCKRCDGVQHPPRAVCTGCGCAELGWVEASGHGTVDTFTVVERSADPAFDPPYVVARVRLVEGPLMLTNLVGVDHDAVRCDAPVVVAWRAIEDGRALPVFAPR